MSPLMHDSYGDCPRTLVPRACRIPFFFFFNDTATTEIYTLSLHDALPIWSEARGPPPRRYLGAAWHVGRGLRPGIGDRKSTRLNSSHQIISYAVFCLKKKKTRTGATASTCCKRSKSLRTSTLSPRHSARRL